MRSPYDSEIGRADQVSRAFKMVSDDQPAQGAALACLIQAPVGYWKLLEDLASVRQAPRGMISACLNAIHEACNPGSNMSNSN